MGHFKNLKNGRWNLFYYSSSFVICILLSSCSELVSVPLAFKFEIESFQISKLGIWLESESFPHAGFTSDSRRSHELATLTNRNLLDFKNFFVNGSSDITILFTMDLFYLQNFVEILLMWQHILRINATVVKVPMDINPFWFLDLILIINLLSVQLMFLPVGYSKIRLILLIRFSAKVAHSFWLKPSHISCLDVFGASGGKMVFMLSWDLNWTFLWSITGTIQPVR